MQNVSAAGDSGEEDDFSKWSLAYTPKYQLLKQGDNELTAKITCLNERNPNADAFHLMSAAPMNSSPPLSKWHTVNVTGVAGAPSVSQALPPASSTEGLVEEEDNEESDEEDIGIEEDIASEEDSSSEEELLTMSRTMMILMRITTRMITILVAAARGVTVTASLVATLF